MGASSCAADALESCRLTPALLVYSKESEERMQKKEVNCSSTLPMTRIPTQVCSQSRTQGDVLPEKFDLNLALWYGPKITA